MASSSSLLPSSVSGRYRHGPLPEGRFIRLLQISSYLRTENGLNWRLHLSTFNLDDSPPFAALSYTWGPAIIGEDEDKRADVPGQPAGIDCDSAQITITENLFDALSQFAHSGFAGYFWGGCDLYQSV